MLSRSRSVDATRCPSWELVLIWLSKLPLLATAMRAEPALPRWAWVDVGLTPTGRPVARELPLTPPAPIAGQASTSTACCAGGRRPRHGLASCHAAGASPSRNQGGCHNELRRTNFSACIIGTFFYGESAALLRLAQLFFARARRYVLRMASPGYAGPKLLCADQDVLEEAVAHEPSLVEEFQVSQREFFGWGWAPPDKQSDNETRPASRRGECAAQDHAPGKVMCRQSHLLLRARRHAKLSNT